MIRLYIIGICILVIAIIANGIIVKIGLLSWYDFIKSLNENGWSAFRQVTVIDYLWLLIGYPFVLSFGYILGGKFYDFLS